MATQSIDHKEEVKKQKVLLISGKKQSGKSSLCNYLVGQELVKKGVLGTFNISNTGKLMVPVDEKQKQFEILDLNQRNPVYFEYALTSIWPHVKNYSIANMLKYMAMELFGLTYDQCFGNEEDKNSQTNIRYSDISFALPRRIVGQLKKENEINEFLTARRFLEIFGTDVCRKIYDRCWVQKVIKDIRLEGYPFVIIDDVRGANEIELLEEQKDLDLIKIRLQREPFKSDTELANSLDGKDELFDLIIPKDVSIVEKQYLVNKFLEDKKWI